MQLLLYADLSNNVLSATLGGGPFSFPKIPQNSHLRIGLRFFKRVDGQPVLQERTVDSLRATIARDDARPTDGDIRLKVGAGAGVIGENVTEKLRFNATDEQVFNALNALTDLVDNQKPQRVWFQAGSWRVTFKDGAGRTISLYESTLFPVSFLRFRTYMEEGRTVHDLRLTQAPVAITDSVAPVVPPAPEIIAVRNGGSESGAEWNEVQELFVPPDFRGTYQLGRGFKKTRLLTVEDDEEDVAEALAAIADEEGEFAVTLPLSNRMQIEFKGSMAAANQDLLTVSVFSAPAGDPTFTLVLNSSALAVLMNAKASERLPFELVLNLEHEQDAEIIERHVFRSDIDLVREVGWDELAVAPDTDYIRPPLPRTYVPVTEDQIEVGVRHYGPVLIGDGVETEFVVDHDLDTEVPTVEIFENATPGKCLVRGVDYTVERDGPDSVIITMLGAYADPVPALNSLYVVVIALAQASQFNAHTHTIAQVVDLQTIINGLLADIEELQGIAGIGDIAADVSGLTSPVVSWMLAPLAVFYPLRKPLEVKDLASLAALDEKLLPRTAGLLPAVHDAATAALTVPLPTDPAEGTYEGNVYENTSGGVVELPGSLGRRTVKLKAGQFAAVLIEDNRESWYRVAKLDAAKSTFYPTDFDRELFSFAVNDKQLRAGKKLTVQFGIELKLYKSNVKARWRLRIEHGAILADSTPGTPDVNVDQVQWNTDDPILDQPIDLDVNASVHQAGCVITRFAEEITAIALLYGASQAAGSAPATANFYLRARLCGFDTEDNEPDPRGIIGLRGLDIATGGTENTALGTAVITTA